MELFKKSSFFPVILVILLTVLAYLNSFHVPFHFDDRKAIVENYSIRNPTDIKEIFYSNPTRFFLTLSNAVNFKLNSTNPFYYHAVNLCLHIMNVVLVYILLSLIINNKYIPFLATLLFAIHPVNVESVTYISGRSSLMCGTFSLLTFLTYINYRKVKNPAYLVLSYLAFVFSMFTKEAAAATPLIIFGYDRILRPEIEKREDSEPRRISNIIIYIPYMLIICLILFIRRIFGGSFGENILARGYFENFLTQCKSSFYAVKLLFLPVNLTIDHKIKPLKYLFSFQSLFFMLFFSGLLLFIYLFRKRNGIISFSILFFISFILPFFVFPLDDILTERWLYLSSIGFCLALGKFFGDLMSTKKGFKIFAISFTAIISLIFFSLVVNRNSVWHNEYLLWEDAVKKAPNKARPHNNLGVAFSRLGKTDKAIEEFRKALFIDKNYIDAYNNLGLAYEKDGKHLYAELEFLKALKLSPLHGGANTNIANLYHKAGRLRDALPYYLRAVKAEPDNPLILTNLGVLYTRIGKNEEALKTLKQSVKFGPYLPEAHYNLGILLRNLGKKEEARDELSKTLDLRPDDKKVKKALAAVGK